MPGGRHAHARQPALLRRRSAQLPADYANCTCQQHRGRGKLPLRLAGRLSPLTGYRQHHRLWRYAPVPEFGATLVRGLSTKESSCQANFTSPVDSPSTVRVATAFTATSRCRSAMSAGRHGCTAPQSIWCLEAKVAPTCPTTSWRPAHTAIRPGTNASSRHRRATTAVKCDDGLVAADGTPPGYTVADCYVVQSSRDPHR